MDLATAEGFPEDLDAIETAREIPDRSRQLWSRLTGAKVLGPVTAGLNKTNAPGEPRSHYEKAAEIMHSAQRMSRIL
jgi:hypothetical protein